MTNLPVVDAIEIPESGDQPKAGVNFSNYKLVIREPKPYFKDSTVTADFLKR